MQLKEYIATLGGKEEQEQFARRCGTSRGHLRNVAYAVKSCGTDLAVSIERESRKAVTRQELRADWANHWPELIKA